MARASTFNIILYREKIKSLELNVFFQKFIPISHRVRRFLASMEARIEIKQVHRVLHHPDLRFDAVSPNAL
jgi:hypothetical protein